jgi:predicted Zn finger-like uncharacterized protein
MNNNCPGCGAVYNVASKDIGRKLKCKKCGMSLEVTSAGLEEDTGGAPRTVPSGGSAPAPAVVAEEDDEPVVKKGKGSKYARTPGVNPLDAVGGVPTILFAFGVFLVILFTSLPIIGQAGTDRANAYVDKLKLEQATKIKALFPKGKKPSELTSEELKRIEDDSKKITDDYEKQIADAGLDAERTKIGNRRDVWMERYGLMFGFIFVSFGCIGYLRTEQPMVLKIVAGATLFFMLLIMFGTFGAAGCMGGRNPLG